MQGSSQLASGDVIAADYRIERHLSSGGMGSVYVAEQLSTGKRRALKVMKPELVTDAKSRRRFIDEAKVGARIESEHIVDVIGAGVDESTGMPWLAMELLDGTDLDEHIRTNGPMPLGEVVEMFEQLAHALGQAHEQGIVHRDLKPENLFLTRGKRSGALPVIKILDFGIASFVASDKTAATVTSAIGSPLWIAPEQATTGAKLKPGTDVWALGLIAFYLLTGKSYWPAANAEDFQLNALLAEILAHPLVPASQRAQELGVSFAVPPAFDEWFAGCVNRDIDARPSDAQAAVAPLLAMARRVVVAPKPPGVAPTMPLSSADRPSPGLMTPPPESSPAPATPRLGPSASGVAPTALLGDTSSATTRLGERASVRPRRSSLPVVPVVGGLIAAVGLAVAIGVVLYGTDAPEVADNAPLHERLDQGPPASTSRTRFDPVQLRMTRPIVAPAPLGSVYLAEPGGHEIQRLQDGWIEYVAGAADAGNVDGPAQDARFGSIVDMAVDSVGILYVADTDPPRRGRGRRGASRIRVVRDGSVRTMQLPGLSNQVTSIAVAPDGAIWVASGDQLQVIRGARLEQQCGEVCRGSAVTVTSSGTVYVLGGGQVHRLVGRRLQQVATSGVVDFTALGRAVFLNLGGRILRLTDYSNGPRTELRFTAPATLRIAHLGASPEGELWLGTTDSVGVLSDGEWHQHAGHLE